MMIFFQKLYFLSVLHCCSFSVVDEDRSCTVSVTNNSPIHIVGSSASQRICGTTFQPWHIEAPVGQTVNIVLLNFNTEPTTQIRDRSEQSCNKHGIILDKVGKRNTTICGDAMQREIKIYSSSGNAVYIMFRYSDQLRSDDVTKFVLKLEG